MDGIRSIRVILITLRIGRYCSRCHTPKGLRPKLLANVRKTDNGELLVHANQKRVDHSTEGLAIGEQLV